MARTLLLSGLACAALTLGGAALAADVPEACNSYKAAVTGGPLPPPESDTVVIRWLANRRARLLRPRSANILRHEDIVEGRTAASQNKKATIYPTDSDLVTACEQWLGVTGTQEAELTEPQQPVRPVTTPTPQEEQRDPVA